MTADEALLAHLYTSIFDRFHNPSRRNMNLEEFRELCRSYFPDARDSDIEMTFEAIDEDHSGTIELPEFLKVARRLFDPESEGDTEG
ncbi:MAG: hypothetical protein EA397_00480 [Deltaproteobacteria bacterium]|nr:MAG: hypothetical protein EA397_00480 [Deltaproteobacteria bacterium]